MLKIIYRNGKVEELKLGWRDWNVGEGFVWIHPENESYSRLIPIDFVAEIIEDEE